MKTREQCLVASLYDSANGRTLADWKRLREEGRAQQLSGMLLRHGLLQVVAFLHRKGGDAKNNVDQQLLDLLQWAMCAVLGSDSVDLTLPTLAKQDGATLLMWNELAIEAAHWIERVAAAKK